MLPRVQPIAPVRRAAPFDDPEWLFDLKYDGCRALCYLEQGSCRLMSSTARSSQPTKPAGRSGRGRNRPTEYCLVGIPMTPSGNGMLLD
jgi:hypothetical protein